MTNHKDKSHTSGSPVSSICCDPAKAVNVSQRVGPIHMKKLLMIVLLSTSFATSAQKGELSIKAGNSFLFNNGISVFSPVSLKLSISYIHSISKKTLLGGSIGHDWQSWYNNNEYLTDALGVPYKQQKNLIKRKYLSIGVMGKTYLSTASYASYSAEYLLNYSSNKQTGYYQDVATYKKVSTIRLAGNLGYLFLKGEQVSPFIEIGAQYYVNGPQKIGVSASVGISF